MSKVSHSVLVCLGSNAEDATERLDAMMSTFRSWWSGVECTTQLRNPACGMPAGVPEYSNQLVRFQTNMSYDEVKTLTKKAETFCGRTRSCIVDADILAYDDCHYHEKDWERPYVKKLLTMFSCLLLFIFTTIPSVAYSQNDDTAKDVLSKAIDYFSGQKYSEALLTFQKLEKSYRLSPRMQAYLGVCYFKTEQYDKAIEVLTPVVDSLKEYAPHERAVYYYSLGESNFQKGDYFKTVPCFEKILAVCNDADRAEVCYRLGFSQMMCAEYEESVKWFKEAEIWYAKTDVNEITKAHREQGRRMMNAIIAKTQPKVDRSLEPDAPQAH